MDKCSIIHFVTPRRRLARFEDLDIAVSGQELVLLPQHCIAMSPHEETIKVFVHFCCSPRYSYARISPDTDRMSLLEKVASSLVDDFDR